MTEMPIHSRSPKRDRKEPTEGNRKVGLLLGLGILLLPIVFAWFLLRKGHSTLSRVIGFVWLALVLFFWIGAVNAPATPPDETTEAGRAPVEQTEAEKEAEARIEAERIRAETHRDIRRNPENYLKLEQVSGTKGGFDTVLIISGRVRNSSDVALKDPTFRCELFGASGTRVGTVQETLFEQIPAQGTKRFSELNMGFMGSTQVATYSCRITDAEVVG